MNNAFFVVSAVTLSVASLPSTTLALPRVPLHSLLGDAPAAPNLTTLQALVDAKAQQYNMSISVGVFSSEFHEFGVASGLADKKGGAAATLDSRYPVGSVTKPWTAAAVMQLYEQGVIDIDKPIAPYVDEILMRDNGTTVAQLWNNDSTVDLVTPRLLMGMRAGLQDYNDTWYKLVTEDDPTFDVTPFDLLHTLNKTWGCPPGTCGRYASTGFELLGLLLAQATNCSTWEEYDQLSVIPPSFRPMFNRTAFPGKGLCSSVPDVVHQYDVIPNTPPTTEVKIVDLFNDSCLNGWACGNIAAAPIDIARFHYYLHNGVIVNNESLAQMMQWQPMTAGWEPQLYGLALMQTFPGRGFVWGPDPLNQTYTVGHAGADYGSYSQLAGFNTMYKFGIAMTSNAVLSLNCSNYPVDPNWWDDASCGIYDEILQIISSGKAARLNCSLCADDECRPLPPPSPLCEPEMETLCGVNRTVSTIAECKRCISLNAANLSHNFGCSSSDLQGFCPVNLVCPPVLDYYCGAVKPATTNTTGPTPHLDPTCWQCVHKDNANATAEADCTVQDMEAFCTPAPQNSSQCYPYLEAACLPAVSLSACTVCTRGIRVNATSDANCSYPQVLQFCADHEPFLSTCVWDI